MLTTVTVAAGGATVVTATCPASNPNVVGGGFSGLGGALADADPTGSFPVGGNSWRVTIGSGGGAGSWSVYAICSK